jgi:DNA-binding Lrp family transcriptional regulator
MRLRIRKRRFLYMSISGDSSLESVIFFSVHLVRVCLGVVLAGQKYLAMIRISPNMAAKLYEPLMEFSENPIAGVKLQEAYQVFGKWDFAVLFEADSNENALHFVGDKIRLVEGVVETYTIPLSPIKYYRKE